MKTHIKNHPDDEWLETDGLGGFASGTVSGVRTRRYHGLLVAATKPPAGRMVLVNGFDAWLETCDGNIPLTAQRYLPDVVAPGNTARLTQFQHRPWPRWTWCSEAGHEVEMELLMQHETSAVFLSWKLINSPQESIQLQVRPFFSGREFHSLQGQNDAFGFAPTANEDGTYMWSFYEDVPEVAVRSNGIYRHDPDWYLNFLYAKERDRGLDFSEDLASPGVFSYSLEKGSEAELVFAAFDENNIVNESLASVKLRENKRRKAFPTPLHQAADAYIVRRGTGHTIIAGYPWFGDWGRDTFIAMRGICLASQRIDVAESILLEWATVVEGGLLPNRFVETGEAPEYNSVDAALWFIVAVKEYTQSADELKPEVAVRLRDAVIAILEGYSKGTIHGIQMDDDNLLACGVPGVQLTWMDAKVGDWVVTPRIGKPVEVNALWLNALATGADYDNRWTAAFANGIKQFGVRFRNEQASALFDVVDVDHCRGKTDASITSNQIFAIGGLPIPIVKGAFAKIVLQTVEEKLLTQIGLRTLAPGSPEYASNYRGDVHQRDSAYHRGTVWPWLTGPFIDAWLVVNGDNPTTRKNARAKFLNPLLSHLEVAGLGHVSEIADAEVPHTPRGCPFQAWSVGELLRIKKRLS